MGMRLENCLSEGSLLTPDYGEDSFLGLIRSMKRWCLAEPEGTIVGEGASHLVFLLIDGLGELLLQRLGPDSFLAKHQVGSLSAVYPSTTTVALATLATAEPPSQHGMAGWWTYLPEQNISTTPLPFTNRFGGGELQLAREVMWPLRPWLADSKVPSLVLTPRDYVDSIFTRYLSGGRERRGYSKPEECVELVQAHQAQHERSFAYVYWPQFDSACHSFGCGAEQTVALFQRLDLLAEQLWKGLIEGSKFVVSADHGLLDIEESSRYILREGDPILQCLLTPPSGEPRNPVFHVKDGRSERFRQLFEERFCESFELVDSRKLQALLGGELSTPATRRFGDFVGVARGPSVIHYRARQNEEQPAFIGYHGGLTPEEMRIPLISLESEAR